MRHSEDVMINHIDYISSVRIKYDQHFSQCVCLSSSPHLTIQKVNLLSGFFSSHLLIYNRPFINLPLCFSNFVFVFDAAVDFPLTIFSNLREREEEVDQQNSTDSCFPLCI